MTFTIARLFAAIEGNLSTDLWQQFQEMSPYEIVTAGTTIGPIRIRDLCYNNLKQAEVAQTFSPFLFPTPALTPTLVPNDLKLILAEILAQAFKDSRFIIGINNAGIKQQVKSDLKIINTKRKSVPQINVYRDVTKNLSLPTTCPVPLADSHFKEVADRHGVTIEAIKAVAKVESGGRTGFDDKNRPKILFEAHHFKKYTNSAFDYTHPHLSTDRISGKKYYAWDQYSRLYEAMILDPIAAVKSASWGKFQVLGSNHSGWPSPLPFARAMFDSEMNHLKSFEAYCVEINIMRHLKTNDWAQFARGYNGKNYKDFDYDTKMAAAYKSFGGK
jgi:hypothetical protein